MKIKMAKPVESKLRVPEKTLLDSIGPRMVKVHGAPVFGLVINENSFRIMFSLSFCEGIFHN
jgi:hypothetical protein